MSIQFEPGTPPPSADYVPLCIPELRGNEWTYIKECLDTGWVSSVGAYVDRFEADLARYVGRQHAVAAVNGTAAIHIALLVSGIQPNDEVLVSSMTFIAPVNAIRYAGAWPVFIDSDPHTWQMDAAQVAAFLETECEAHDGVMWNRHTGRRVRAIMPVHILGHPVDMDSIMELARQYGLTVIEDATESLGARYKDRMTGAIGDIACFSFNGNKIITTGGGGMLVTDRQDWAEKARYLTTQAKDDRLEFIHNEIGYNYRLTNVQAAMGVAQLEHLEEFIVTKRHIARIYDDAFRDVAGLTLLPEAPWAYSIKWMYTMLVDEDVYGMDSRALLSRLQENRVESRPLWQPAHLSPAHSEAYAMPCPVAERLKRQAISLPCSVGLTANQQQRVIDLVKNTMYNA
jgi:perosamine synthetase